jgi:dephospho-CoA kinase
MLRVGLTGGIGSGKSTVAAMLRDYGWHILEADVIAREMMQPGQEVFRRIVEAFGPSVVHSDGTLNRPRLASLAFRGNGLSELNQIVHPPVIAEQERRMNDIFARDPQGIAVVESALIFEAEAWGTIPNWRRRFDRILLVTAPEDLRIRRFLARTLPAHATPEERAAAERDARSRLAAQLPDSAKIPHSNGIIDNSGSVDATRRQVDHIVAELRAATALERPASLQ